MIGNSEGGVADCTPGAVGCIPLRPDSSTSSASDATEASFALRNVVLDQYDTNLSHTDIAQQWRTIGFNVDGIDTNSESAPLSCQQMPDPDGGLPVVFPIDGVNGIDNAFGSVLVPNFVGATVPNLEDAVCCFHQRGRGTIIMQLTKWNGTPNDAQVTIALMVSSDATSLDPATTPLSWDAAAGKHELIRTSNSMPADAPSWAPNMDTYYISPREISGGDLTAPKHFDTNGYVRDGYVVMTMNSSQPIKLYLGASQGISIGLQDGRMLAHISADGNYLDAGTMGGRMGSTELREASLRLLASGADQAFCNSVITDIINPLINQYGDVLANGQVNENAPCDALSVGVRFRGVRLRGLRVATDFLCVPFPDCDGLGQPCDATADDATCPLDTAACTIPAWTGPN